MSSYGFPDGQEITQWLGQPLAQQTGYAIGAGSKVEGPFVLANFASLIVSMKPTGGPVSFTIKQTIRNGPPGLQLSQTVVVPAGSTLFEAFVLFADEVTITFQGSVGGTTVDYAIYPSNTTTNAQVIQSASISIQKNEVAIASEPTLDFVDSNQNLWSVVDDAANTRIKLALLAGFPSVLVSRSAADAWLTNGGGTGAEQPMQMDTESWDTDAFHDPAVNPSRLVVPAGLGGKYVAIGWVSWALSAAGFRQIGFRKNGVALAGVNIQPGVAVGGEQDMQVVQPVALAAGDYLELGVYQNTGGNLNTNAGSYIFMARIGP